MNFFDFFTVEELEDAPEDDAIAFAHLVAIAQRKLAAKTVALDESNHFDSETLNDARLGFINVMIALAKVKKIKPFASMEVPLEREFGPLVYKQFKVDLDHYIAQLIVGNSARAKRESVLLADEAKREIRDHINDIKKVIDAADMPSVAKARMLKSLADFEAALDGRRLSLLSATMLLIAAVALPHDAKDSWDAIAASATKIFQVVAHEKLTEDQTRQLPPTEPPLALSPPRIGALPRPGRKTSATPLTDDVDDEIPF